jgi:CHASE3 domain sensor protein
MKWSIGNKIASAFGLALAALLVVGAVSHDSTAKLIDSAEWVTHSHQVVTALEPLVASKFAELRSTIGAGRPTPPDSGHGT